ncbi:hypothetical protein MNBD_UNCLBAC01-200 [hydrothermal vent metagenome]|uniref:ABC3 transporter permease C-terminal domain-containing protein n=1 Tax=hydrothermal vent metagenome TaxID=652676 RepID=A0A3B1D0U6_9ZZZZ
MNIQIKKSIKDLRLNFSRTILVVLALVVGLIGVGATTISYVIATNDLNESFLKTNPFHVEMTSKDFNLLELDNFRKRPEIQSAEFRDFAADRVEVFPDKWVPLMIYGVEDFNNFNLAEFYVEEGDKTPKTGTMLIERDGKKISNLQLSSIANIRTGKGKFIKIPISGISFDPVQAPSSQDHIIYSYVDKKTFTNITGRESNERLIFRLKNIKTKDDIEKLTQAILDDFKAYGIKVEKIVIPKPNTHPHQWQLNTILFLKGSIGFLAFLIGAVLVWQLMSAILASQIRQIGILKAIGASNVQVIRIYLMMVLILGAIASIIAIPLSVKFGYAFAQFVAYQLNFDILTTSLPTYLYFYLIAVAILLPILTSLPAILKGVKIPVNEAINDYGILLKKTSNKVNFLSALPLSKSTILAFGNTLRRKNRLAITVLTLGLGVAIFNTGFNVQQSIINMLYDQSKTLKYDVQITLKEPVAPDEAMRPFLSLQNIKNIQTRGGAKGFIQTGLVQTSSEATIFSLPHDTNLFKPEVLQGHWLQKSDEPEIVINQKILETFENAVIGNYYNLSIKGKLLKVKLVGIIKEFGLGRIYIDKEIFNKHINPDNLVKSILLVAKNNSLEKIIKLEKNIEEVLALSMLSVSNVESQSGRMKVLYDHLNVILVMLLVMAFAVLVVGTLGMASAMSINIIERTREIGVLRAIGATPKMIYKLFVTEGRIIGVLSTVLGFILAWPLSIAASGFFGNLIMSTPFEFAVSVRGVVITIVVVFVFSFIASLIPASKAVKISAREALSYG